VRLITTIAVNNEVLPLT